MANVLIIKLGALGDVVMSTSLIKQIQSFHSTDKLFLLTSKPFDNIFHAWKDLAVHTVERKGFINNLKTLAWIRSINFSSVYDLQSNDRSGLYCALSGIPSRVGNHPRYPYTIHPKDTYKGQCHIYKRMLEVLESAGIPAEPCLSALPATENERQRVSSWINKNRLVNKSFIIIHAGGSKQHPEKRWPYFEKLAKKLSLSNKTIVWIGGNDDLEINKHLTSVAGINACNIFTFSELAELGRHASFAITNDSGPMHILSCSGIPVYGLFGPTNWKRNHAICQENRVITAQIDGDSKLENYNDFIPVSLDTLPVDAVIKRLTLDGIY
jgi:ADP-heptose:LPS heptosyltransferase